MLSASLAILCSAPPIVTVDATRRTPISPYIYGANFPDWKKLGVPFTVARLGGNRTTAYNWENNASNAGNDYRHQNDGYMGESNEAGLTYREFLQSAQSHGAIPLLTIPTAGYVSADKGPDNDVNRTPDYIHRRFHRSLAKKPGKLTYPPNTKDKFVYQDEFAAWLYRIKSPRTPLWFSLDNEPDLWGSTHQRIWPKPPTIAEIIANNIEFGSALKAVAPKSMIFGPANYGWQGFRTFQNAADYRPGTDFLDIYLRAMRDAERKRGRRILDVLDIHWYPEARGGGQRIAWGEDKPGTAEARIQAPRSLWDPTYVEDSWIAESIGRKPIVLLPGIQGQIRRNYPGTKFGITEYDFGGGKNVSGLIAQADVLGLFGRYGLFAATHWGIAPDDPSQIAGFRAFRNFDGRGANFADQGLAVSGVRPAEASVFAAVDSKNPRRMTIVAINKTKSAMPLTLALRGFRATNARGYLRDAAFAPKALPVRVGAGRVSANLPALSVTTIEVR